MSQREPKLQVDIRSLVSHLNGVACRCSHWDYLMQPMWNVCTLKMLDWICTRIDDAKFCLSWFSFLYSTRQLTSKPSWYLLALVWWCPIFNTEVQRLCNSVSLYYYWSRRDDIILRVSFHTLVDPQYRPEHDSVFAPLKCHWCSLHERPGFLW